MSFTEKWMEREIIKFTEISQIQKNNYHIFLLTCECRLIIIIWHDCKSLNSGWEKWKRKTWQMVNIMKIVQWNPLETIDNEGVGEKEVKNK
jgi:hypothetical protein